MNLIPPFYISDTGETIKDRNNQIVIILPLIPNRNKNARKILRALNRGWDARIRRYTLHGNGG